MDRVSCFIDGFNLYHAIHDLGRPELKWLDLRKLSGVFIRPRTQVLKDVFYFSAFAHWLPDARKRHVAYVRALSSRGVIPVMGQFKRKNRACKQCGARWFSHEEKETDVNIALAILNLAHRNQYDHAILITGDSDLAPAVNLVLSEFPDKRITVVAPPHRGHSSELIQVASFKSKITITQLERCLLPQKVFDAGGNLVAARPVSYDPK